jgi:hypothetical protein
VATKKEKLMLKKKTKKTSAKKTSAKKTSAKKKPTVYGMTSQDIINKTKKKRAKA